MEFYFWRHDSWELILYYPKPRNDVGKIYPSGESDLYWKKCLINFTLIKEKRAEGDEIIHN